MEERMGHGRDLLQTSSRWRLRVARRSAGHRIGMTPFIIGLIVGS
jgi:hypothetical protein